MIRPDPALPVVQNPPSAGRAALRRQQPLRVVVAYNPQAGRFSPRLLTRLCDTLRSAGHRVVALDSLDFRVPAVRGKIDLACLLGGDGTARTVISRNRLAATNTAYCVYPAGTVNLLAREAGYPGGPAAFLARLGQDRSETGHHFGLVGEHAFLCCASVGPDSEVVARLSGRLKQRIGRLAYGAALLGMLRRWPRHRLTVTVDGQVYPAEAVYVCKGRYYAGPWVLDDAADLRAPQFRVLLLNRARRRDTLRLALSAMISRRLADPAWIRLSAHSVEVAAGEALPVQADGDIVASTPVAFTVSAEPLTFL